MIDFEADQATAPSGDTLERVAKLGQELKFVNAWHRESEEVLRDLKERRRVLPEETIPNVLSEVGLADFGLVSGQRVEVKPFYRASLPTDSVTRAAAFEWLREHGHGDLIKNEVIVLFGAGQDTDAEAFVEHVREACLDPETKTTVHGQTLKAFVREQYEAENEIPLETLGAYVGRAAEIIAPTKAKSGRR